ncbi:MAG: c-type cytochrome biogenesis protein CcmI [Gammaproteobacteria bacterium]|nr:c-type cytochrome biogenesis protein CcmI [Gammaproteobacteria bacterium]
MIVFGVIVGLLVLTALLLIVPPLIGRGRHGHARVVHREVNLAVFRQALAELERDLEAGTIEKDQYEVSRKELESRLLEEVELVAPTESAPAVSGSSRAVAVIVALVVPAFAIGMYFYQGTPQAINPERAGASSAAATMQDSGDMSAKIQAMVASLADKLKKNPDDAAGWAMLGRSYIVLERFDDARTALEKAASLNQGDPQLLADLADSLAMTSGESLQGRPTELILQALAIDPNNQKALWLAGTAAYEASDYAQALKYWRKLYQMLPQGSETAKTMEGNIAEAQALLEGVDPSQFSNQGAAGGEDLAAASSGASTARVTGRVSLAPELRAKVKGDDTVFIFAKAVQGPPMPLAVQRAKVSDLPMNFELDDSMAMSPQMTLSRFPQVVIMARVSHTGNAMPQSGDLQGTSAPVAVGSKVPEVKIDQVIP